jgi:uncharacterized OB-fold protein
MMVDYGKPLPEVNETTKPFWDACRADRLDLQKCKSCDHLRYPVSHVCPECLSYDHEWVTVSGKGEVFSYIVFHQVYNQAFAKDVPYNVAVIQLAEGPRMISNVTGVPNDQVKVGDKVQVTFDHVTDDVAIPRFRPAT